MKDYAIWNSQNFLSHKIHRELCKTLYSKRIELLQKPDNRINAISNYSKHESTESTKASLSHLLTNQSSQMIIFADKTTQSIIVLFHHDIHYIPQDLQLKINAFQNFMDLFKLVWFVHWWINKIIQYASIYLQFYFSMSFSMSRSYLKLNGLSQDKQIFLTRHSQYWEKNSKSIQPQRQYMWLSSLFSHSWQNYLQE